MNSIKKQTYAAIPLILLFFAACSQHRTIVPVADDSQAQDSGTTQELPIEVRPAGQDPGRPSAEGAPLLSTEEGDALTEDTDTGVIVQWTKRLPVPGGDRSPELFMVFPGKVFGQQILSLTYHSSILNVKDQANSLQVEDSAIPDESLGSWSVPLFHSFGSSLSALDTGVLHVRFNFLNGTQKAVEIRFNVVPGLPDPKDVLVSQVGSEFDSSLHRESLEVIQDKNSQGRVVSQQTYANPTSRPLVLWFHDLGSNLTLSQQVSYHVAIDSQITPTTPQLEFEPNANRFSLVELDHWIMTSSSGSQSEGALSDLAFSWKSLTLQPKQKVSLTWKVFPKEGSSKCSAQASVSYPMAACLIPGLNGQFLGLKLLHEASQSSECGSSLVFMNPETASEVVTGSQVLGHWSQEVILAEAGFDPSSAASRNNPSDAGLSERISGGASPNGEALGAKPEDVSVASLPHYSCQGVF